jgi:glycosyltransferase involved in cell wall biosynthesis
MTGILASAATPMVSVVMPCYRQAGYLPEAVASLREQTYQCWECIIVNDGSPDDTRKVAAELMLADTRIRYVEQENRGLAAARNRGLAEARGEYIQFLDSDDMLLPTKFELQLEAATTTSERCVLISDYWLMNESGTRFENAMCTPEFHLGAPVQDIALRWEVELSIAAHAFLFDARLFRDHDIHFDETLPNHEDWDCWMRVFRLHPTIRRVHEKLAVYRVRSDSMARDDERMWSGFRQAIASQLGSGANDAMMCRMLAYKRKLTDDFYGKSLRVRVLGKLRRSGWFAKAVPTFVQQAVYRRLDLTDLRAHGWL